MLALIFCQKSSEAAFMRLVFFREGDYVLVFVNLTPLNSGVTLSGKYYCRSLVQVIIRLN